MRKGLNLLYWPPAIAWAFTIYYYSIISYSEKPKLAQDKLQHIMAYFILAFLVYVALQHTAKRRFTTSALLVLSFCLLYAGGIQLNQGHIASRGGDFDDWLAGAGGSALVFVFLLALKKLGGKGRTIYALLSNGADDQTTSRDS